MSELDKIREKIVSLDQRVGILIERQGIKYSPARQKLLGKRMDERDAYIRRLAATELSALNHWNRMALTPSVEEHKLP